MPIHHLSWLYIHRLLSPLSATVMLENGADIRFIQQLLGHVSLDTTQIYTQVSIRMLKQIRTATHPTAKLKRFKKEPETTP